MSVPCSPKFQELVSTRKCLNVLSATRNCSKKKGEECRASFTSDAECVEQSNFECRGSFKRNTHGHKGSWVSSTLASGQGYVQMRDITSILEIPCMTKDTFLKHQMSLSSLIQDAAWQEMESAGREEVELAISSESVDGNGIPVITVITDGAWCKRSFGSSYNAFSGVVSGLHKHVLENTKEICKVNLYNK
ncbi:hypothetical protein PR048_027813 [Dryococelus australis]|uniref:Mutator-like transposase domain-containing protein n=1 Tax=Dryococelus australis TaxID=614101 RepID=A0ABQ9GHH6_9NEOP|nr:hypothetical protein PR048_027813 [Dryococelus australis]